MIRKSFQGKKLSLCESYQPEGPQHRQAFYVGQAQLHQTQTNDNAVKDVPTLLKIVVRVQGDDLEAHFSCEDASENLVTREDGYNVVPSHFAFRSSVTEYLPGFQLRGHCQTLQSLDNAPWP